MPTTASPPWVRARCCSAIIALMKARSQATLSSLPNPFAFLFVVKVPSDFDTAGFACPKYSFTPGSSFEASGEASASLIGSMRWSSRPSAGRATARIVSTARNPSLRMVPSMARPRAVSDRPEQERRVHPAEREVVAHDRARARVPRRSDNVAQRGAVGVHRREVPVRGEELVAHHREAEHGLDGAAGAERVPGEPLR